MSEPKELTVSVLIPCLNNQAEIGTLVRSFLDLTPKPRVIVVDNCSTKETIDLARSAGAEVIVERRRGKAQAIISALPQIDSDVVILAPSDGSFPAEGARRMLEFFGWERPDMIIGVPNQGDERDYRHKVVNFAFNHEPDGLTSELRLLSRFFYKNIPILTRGYSLEIELTVQALDKHFRMATVPVPYVKPTHPSTVVVPPRSFTGQVAQMVSFLLSVLRDYKPMILFGGVALIFALAGLVVGSVPIYEYFTSGIVRRLSMPVLAASLMIIAFFTLQIGVVLESSLRYRRETYQTQLRRQFEPVSGAGPS